MLRRVLSLVLVLAGILSAGFASAHPASMASAQAKVREDGSFTLHVRFDLPAYILDDVPANVDDQLMLDLMGGTEADLQKALDDAERRFRRDLTVRSGSHNANIEDLEFPSAAGVLQARDLDGSVRLPVIRTVTVNGKLPEHSRKFSFMFPEMLGITILTVEMPYQEPISEPVQPGYSSGVFVLPTAAEIAKAKASMLPAPIATEKEAPPATVEKKGGGNKAAADSRERPAEKPAEKGPKPLSESTEAKPRPAPETEPQAEPEEIAASAPVERGSGGWSVFGSFLVVGFQHILPAGGDHILFVLGLFLLSRKTKDLVKQITAFTLAHTLTIALSLYGVVRLPSHIIEPVIALSIAFVAIENLVTKEMKSWRPFVVFGFGLFHGLGFAGSLVDTGIPQANLLPALLGFNLGVEVGQLAVVAAALAAVGWMRSRPSYRTAVVMPASACIAALALFWTVERIV